MAVIGAPRSYHDRHRFLVQIPGVLYAGFAKCSELKATVSLRKHREGGNSMPHKAPGLYDMENLTLERGATTDLQLYNMFARTARMASGTGNIAPYDKVDMSLLQLSRAGTPVLRWDIYGAFAIEFVAGEWDASSDEATIGKVVMAADYFEPVIVGADASSGVEV